MTTHTRRITDVPGVADYIDDTERHIRHLIATRAIPFFRVGRKIRFDLDQIDAWTEAHSVPVGGAA